MQQSKGLSRRVGHAVGGLYSIAELEQVTQVPLRALQFWTSSGILQTRGSSAHPGRGHARYFEPSEARMAIALKPLYEGGMPTGKLKELAEEIRPEVTKDANLRRIQLVFSDRRWRLSAGISASPALLPQLILPL